MWTGRSSAVDLLGSCGWESDLLLAVRSAGDDEPDQSMGKHNVLRGSIRYRAVSYGYRLAKHCCHAPIRLARCNCISTRGDPVPKGADYRNKVCVRALHFFHVVMPEVFDK